MVAKGKGEWVGEDGLVRAGEWEVQPSGYGMNKSQE